jgi:hypothetical protein
MCVSKRVKLEIEKNEPKKETSEVYIKDSVK